MALSRSAPDTAYVVSVAVHETRRSWHQTSGKPGVMGSWDSQSPNYRQGMMNEVQDDLRRGRSIDPLIGAAIDYMVEPWVEPAAKVVAADRTPSPTIDSLL